MRESSRHVEAVVEKAADVPKMRVSSRHVEVVIRNAPPPGWTIGAVALAR